MKDTNSKCRVSGQGGVEETRLPAQGEVPARAMSVSSLGRLLCGFSAASDASLSLRCSTFDCRLCFSRNVRFHFGPLKCDNLRWKASSLMLVTSRLSEDS